MEAWNTTGPTIVANVKIRLFSISSAAVVTNNTYLIYEMLLLLYLILPNLVQNQDKLDHNMQSLTQ